MKITLVITFVRPVLMNETVQQQYTARPTRATENGQNTMAHMCIMVQLTHTHTHTHTHARTHARTHTQSLKKEMRAE